MAEINDLENSPDPLTTARWPEGQKAGQVNNAGRDLEGLLSRGFKDSIDGILTTGGTSTAYTVTPNRTLTAYYDGLELSLKFHVASGAAPTLDVSSLGADALVWPDGGAIAENQLAAGAIVQVKRDEANTRWVVQSLPGPSSAMEVITSGTVSSAAALQLTDLSSIYRALVLVIDDALLDTGSARLLGRTSIDNGTSFEAGASDYAHTGMIAVVGDTTPNSDNYSNGESAIELSGKATGGGFGTTAGTSEASGTIEIYNPTDSGSRTVMLMRSVHRNNSADLAVAMWGGHRNAAEANDAIEILTSSGLIVTMNYTLYGVRAS